MQRWFSFLALFTGVCVTHAQVVDLPARGQQPYVVNEDGRKVPLYEASYALLISERNYIGAARNGWRQLDATSREMDSVADTLRDHGFFVRRATDLSSADLTSTFRDFMADYGQHPNHRLLFFFAGHGYTNSQTDMGYIVPVDALDPNLNPGRFYSRALPIETIQIWARELVARHVLFIFDSCFSGSIFMSRGPVVAPDKRGETPSERLAFFKGSSARPVRQFISAGGPKEELPATSIFVPLFIEAINGRAARTDDGYVTGKELGMWLEQNVPRYRAVQNPHSGVIRQPDLSFGDIVFQKPATVAARIPAEVPKLAVAISPSTGSAQKTGAFTSSLAEKVSLSLDVFFDFDKAVLKPESKAQLDALVGKTKGMVVEVVLATGHTDNFSSDAYSQKLSVALAESVKAYLVALGIDRNRIYTEGKGSKAPVADNKTAEGRSKNRRVEIEMVGTRK